MVRSPVALTLLLFLVLLSILPRARFFAATPAGPGHAPRVVTAAMELTAPPREGGAKLSGQVPLPAPALLSALYRLGVRAGDDPSDPYQFDARFQGGSPQAVTWARWGWLALQIVLLLLLFRVGGSGPGIATGWSRFAAPALLAVAPLAVSAAVRVDPAVLASLAATGAMAIFLAGTGGPQDHWRWIVGGALLGLAASSHPQGIAYLSMLVLLGGAHRGSDRWVRLGTALVAVTLGALAGDPRLAEDPGLLFSRFGGEASAVSVGGVGMGRILFGGLAPTALVLAAIGAVSLARRGRFQRWVSVALVLPVAILLVTSGRAGSSAVLALPPVLLLAGAALGWIERVRPRREWAVIALAAVLLWPGALTARQMLRAGRGDSRVAASAWLRDHLPPDARVVIDHYGPELPPDRISFTLPFNPSDASVYAGAYDPGWYEGFDTFIFVSTQYDRYERDPIAYSQQLAFVRALRRFAEPAATFRAGPYAGPTVEILVRERPPTGTGLARLLDGGLPEPRVPDFYLSLGAAYRRMGDLSTALRLLEVARHLSPDDPRVAVNLAGVYLDMGEESRAEEILGDAVRRNPEFAILRYQYGRIKQQRRLWGEAIGEYKMAVRYEPSFVEAHFNLAICYFEAGNRQGARNSFRRVLELAPEGVLGEEARRMIEELGTP